MPERIEVDLTKNFQQFDDPEDQYASLRAMHKDAYHKAERVPDGTYVGEIVAIYPAYEKTIVTLIRIITGPEAGKSIRKFNNLTSDRARDFFKSELKLIDFEVQSREELIHRGEEIKKRQVKFSAETNESGFPVYRILGLAQTVDCDAAEKSDW